MDQSSSKRGSGGLATPRKAYNLAFKGAPSEGEHNGQFCNRIGCSGRIKSNQNTRIGSSDCKERIKCNQNMRTGSSDKANCSKPSFRSSNGNETSGKSSSRLSSMMTASTKKSSLDSKRKLSSQLKFDPSKSTLSSESEDPETTSSPMSLTGYDSESTTKPEEVTMTETGSSSLSPNARPRKIFHHKSRLSNQNTQPSSSVPSTSRISSVGQLNQSNESKYGLKNLKCNSTSDVVRPNCSPVGKNLKRSSEGESSFSHRGRKTNPSSPSDRNFSPSSSGVSISDSRRSSSASVEDSSSPTSAWTRRSMNVNTRMRLCNRQNGRNISAVRDPSVNISQTPDTETTFIGGRSSLRQFSASGPRAPSLLSSNGDNPSSIMPFTSAEPGFTYRYNMDGIAEVLLALERIEQDEELTHEQVLALETSLFLSGLNLYDQHRDMRLDIDNMSYEELLALEERMGTVSTALSEEALSNCLRRIIYQGTGSKFQITGSHDDGDDIKCSICQEEYVVGEELGKLVECQHRYHIKCVKHWLQLKNWCPICKASVQSSSSS